MALADEGSVIGDAGSGIVSDGFNAVDAGSALGAGGATFTDNLANVLFTVAFISLVLLTLGVLYLSLASWLDDRQESSDKDTAGPASQYEEDMARYQGAIGKKKTTKKPVSKATPKGFGKD